MAVDLSDIENMEIKNVTTGEVRSCLLSVVISGVLFQTGLITCAVVSLSNMQKYDAMFQTIYLFRNNS